MSEDGDENGDFINKSKKQCEIGWELNRKHIFVLSSAGKPIFSRYGDEQDLVTTFGLLQAVISIVVDSGDMVRALRAGNRTVVYLVKNSLYFICMSTTNEPEIMLLSQLEFMYEQILFVLTCKIHDVLKANPSSDIRQLLGTDTTRWLASACVADVLQTSVAFDSLKSFVCNKDLRDDICFHLRYCVEKSGAA